MADNETGGTWTQWEEDDSGNKNMAAGAILASAVAAGVIAYVLRRARQEEEQTPTGLAGKAFERTRGVVGDDRVEAGREFIVKKVMPEFKPALLAILDELEDVVDSAFRRAEKAIKSL